MANIYNISQELNDIIFEIENNGGEITPELEEALIMKEEELKDKVKAYTQVISSIESDITAIKEEKSRLNDLQKSKERTIESLKKVLLMVINQFGDTTKSGSKFIDFGTGKVSTRKTEVVVIDDDKVEEIQRRFTSMFNYYKEHGVLDETNTDVNELIGDVICGLDKREEICSLNDLNLVNANFKFKFNVKHLISSQDGIKVLRLMSEYFGTPIIETSVSKTDIKDAIKAGEPDPSFAILQHNQTITIK